MYLFNIFNESIDNNHINNHAQIQCPIFSRKTLNFIKSEIMIMKIFNFLYEIATDCKVWSQNMNPL